MNRIAGAIVMLAAAVCGHAVLVFLASNRAIYKYDISDNTSKLVVVAMGTAVVLGVWGGFLLFKNDQH
jgi:hypothetical protein